MGLTFFDQTNLIFGASAYVWAGITFTCVLLSYFGRWQASSGNHGFAKFVLLPAFEYMMVVRISQILFFWGMTTYFSSYPPGNEATEQTVWVLIIANFNAFVWVYAVIWVFLASQSAGSGTLRRGFVCAGVLFIAGSLVTWGECTQSSSLFWYLSKSASDTCRYCHPRGGWGTQVFFKDAFGKDNEYCVPIFTLFLRAIVMLFFLGAMLISVAVGYWEPRRFTLLLGGMCSILVPISALGAIYYSVCYPTRCSRYAPAHWFGWEMCLETLGGYLVTLFESWYWSQYVLVESTSVSHSTLDTTLAEPLLTAVATTMTDLSARPWSKVPHIPLGYLVCSSLLPRSSESVRHSQVLFQNSMVGVEVHSGMYLGKAVAIKKLTCEELCADTIRGACKELKISASLVHENVVRTHGLSISPPHIMICMELCDGSLYNSLYCDSRPFSVHQACSMLVDVATGVAYLHEKSVIHCDLKSLNVLLAEENGSTPICKICDFGESCVLSSASTEFTSGELLGTALWSPPEVLERPRSYSVFSDVFALALIGFECFTRSKFWTTGSGNNLSRHPPSFEELVLDGFRPELNMDDHIHRIPQALLQRAWAREPKARGTADQFAQELSNWLECCADSELGIPSSGLPICVTRQLVTST